ncbi:hypothetical protein ACFE04_006714 [Oxalis oulophora]
MACTIDFRCLDEGFGGKTYKRKRELANSTLTAAAEDVTTMEVDEAAAPPPAKRAAIASADNPDKPTFGKPTYDGVIAGRVSGRNWKQPRKHRASAKSASVKGKGLEEREKEKRIKLAFRERINELKEEIRNNKVEKRKAKEEREKRKEENVLRTGTKFQKITNPNTLKRLSKSKQKRLLKVVPDEFVNNNNNKRGSK